MKTGKDRKKRVRRYHWDEWFACEAFEIERGIDYFSTQSTMCQAIRNEASRRGIYVHLEDADFKIRVLVRDGSKLGTGREAKK